MKQYKDFVNEGPNDPAIFKAIFLAGGPGSGKSFMVGQTSLAAHGFKIVNSDVAFEKAMEKAGLTMDPETIFSAQGQAIRDKAKRLTGIQFERYVEGRLGLVIDGTGKDEEKIRNRFDEYNNKTAPLRAFYEAQGKFHSVNGIGEIEEITQRLTALIDGLLIK